MESIYMKRVEATEAIVRAKAEKNLSWEQIAKHVGRSEVWTTSACLGQQKMDKEEAKKVCELLNLGENVEWALQQNPLKGCLERMPPTDPTIYRFYEVLQVYGTTLKELIEEKFGSGIMSAIDFKMDLEKEENPQGDRVKVTMSGKFLPYKKW